jgi:hypothetical protein
VNKAGSKFVGAKAKCASKCLQNFWKPPEGSINPDTDCLAPYGGATAECVKDTTPIDGLKGAEDKFALSIKKKCDGVTKPGAECPGCYSGGDCSDSGYATDQVQNIEGQVDSFGPGVFCERAGASKEEQTCQLNTAKTLSKLVGSVNKCYDKCIKNSHKGIGTFGDCLPPASDATTLACIGKADLKAIAGVDKKCAPRCYDGPDVDTLPDTCSVTAGGCTTDADCGSQANRADCSAVTDSYPSGAQWVNLVETAISVVFAGPAAIIGLLLGRIIESGWSA